MKKKGKSATDIGLNKSGIATSPVEAKRLIEGAEKLTPDASLPADPAMARMRMEYTAEAEPVGTMPPPASLRGVASTALQALKGNKANVLLDKLGERLAVERTGVRLYDAAMAKLAATGSWEGGPSLEDLKEIREDEFSHFRMLSELIETMGADPTVMTPCADVAAVASSGVIKVLSDPRTNAAQALEALLIAELTDVDGWSMLIDLTESAGMKKSADKMREALLAEEGHLSRVRGWLKVRTAAEASRELEPAAP